MVGNRAALDQQAITRCAAVAGHAGNPAVLGDLDLCLYALNSYEGGLMKVGVSARHWCGSKVKPLSAALWTMPRVCATVRCGQGRPGYVGLKAAICYL